MSVTNVEKSDTTMTITAEFDAPVERVWELWENPRKLEKWWGPPTYPATMVDFDLKPGGVVNYFMTGPNGEHAGGWWDIVAVDAPNSLEFKDGFSDEKGARNPKMPSTVTTVKLNERPAGGTLMTISSKWASADHMKQMLDMGMEEGMTAAMGQMDALLA
jgi:uncharacterized protein YndB with AHSA1/START domain